MRLFGVILIVLGALALAYRGFTYRERENVVDIGGLKLDAEREKTIPIPLWASGAAIAVGVALILVPGRRR